MFLQTLFTFGGSHNVTQIEEDVCLFCVQRSQGMILFSSFRKKKEKRILVSKAWTAPQASAASKMPKAWTAPQQTCWIFDEISSKMAEGGLSRPKAQAAPLNNFFYFGGQNTFMKKKCMWTVKKKNKKKQNIWCNAVEDLTKKENKSVEYCKKKKKQQQENKKLIKNQKYVLTTRIVFTKSVSQNLRMKYHFVCVPFYWFYHNTCIFDQGPPKLVLPDGNEFVSL